MKTEINIKYTPSLIIIIQNDREIILSYEDAGWLIKSLLNNVRISELKID